MLRKDHENPLDLFRSHLKQVLSPEHPLYKLAGQIDGSVFDVWFDSSYSEGDRINAILAAALYNMRKRLQAFQWSLILPFSLPKNQGAGSIIR